MAKKREVQVIHPRVMLDSIGAYHQDCQNLLTAARHAMRFMGDDTLDQEKVRGVVSPILQEAIDRMERWNDGASSAAG